MPLDLDKMSDTFKKAYEMPVTGKIDKDKINKVKGEDDNETTKLLTIEQALDAKDYEALKKTVKSKGIDDKKTAAILKSGDVSAIKALKEAGADTDLDGIGMGIITMSEDEDAVKTVLSDPDEYGVDPMANYIFALRVALDKNMEDAVDAFFNTDGIEVKIPSFLNFLIEREDFEKIEKLLSFDSFEKIVLNNKNKPVYNRNLNKLSGLKNEKIDEFVRNGRSV